MKNIRRSILSGSWYSGNSHELKKEIISLEKKCKNVHINSGKIIGLVAPHAGYMYSGRGALTGYKLLRNKPYDNIIILAPSHSGYFSGIACSVYDNYETPFGTIKVNKEKIETLKANSNIFKYDKRAEDQEHSVEIHLPLLQHNLKDFKIIPLLIGNLNENDIPAISKAVKHIVNENTLLIASSDFTHYGSRFGYNPFDDLIEPQKIGEKIKDLDLEHIKHILGLDYMGFLELKKRTGASICGYMAIALVISIFHSRDKPLKTHLAEYYSSGDITGDYRQAVSYGTILFYE